MLHNYTAIVILHAFHSCWRLFALDQIQLDAYCTVIWRQYVATFKLWPVILIFERNEMTEYPRKPWQPTLIGITWYIQPFSTQSARSVLYRFFFCSCATSRFSSQGTVNSMRETLFFELHTHTHTHTHTYIYIYIERERERGAFQYLVYKLNVIYQRLRGPYCLKHKLTLFYGFT